jgi:hypothetical protein
MFDTATPNPTGSLSGPWFDLSGSGNVTGVVGRNSHLACRVKNLANQTVRTTNNIIYSTRKKAFTIVFLSFLSTPLGVMDQTQGHSPSNSWPLFLYKRSSIGCHSSIQFRRLGA